ncbi:MAG: flagellar biosynthetic protein FliQ [Bryobacteraceae bacterium]|nr:flagellar biosynthetic protein FliQ [Bryobacteraceae bacterium]
MTPELAVQILRQTLMTAFWVGLPLLAIGFVAGLIVGLVQIATSIQDASFNTVPRLLAFLGGLLLTMPWMLEKLKAFTLALLKDLARYAG